jgi:Ca-activated chloride channel homolog
MRYGRRIVHNWIRGAAFFAVAILAAVGIAYANSPPALKSDLAVERGAILKGDSRVLYVLVHFTAPELDLPQSARPPLNLTLVLDRSGSMADKGKIEYLRQAAKMAVASLSTRDSISVVEFDDRITTMWPASHAGDTGELQRMIDQLAPRGSTNLASGLQTGVSENKSAEDRLHLSRETLDRVILLSDGLANTGVTDHGEIARMASAARDEGVRVSTIGLGLDYDEDLMQAIAESGGGKYYYVESPVQLAGIFEHELKTAFETRARDVHLAFHGSGAVRSAEILGYASGGRDVSTDWPDFYAGETRSVLLRLVVDAPDTGPLDLGRFDVAWRDAQSGASGTLDLPIRVDVTEDEAASGRSLNKNVAVEAALAESERKLAANVKLYEAGQAGQAEASNAAVIADLKAKNATLKDQRLTRKIEALDVEQSQMAAAAAPAAPPEARESYLKASKQRLYRDKSGNRSDALKLGDRGLAVEELQKALAAAGFYQGKITGVYDQATADAVRKFQQSKQIVADGIAGAATQAALGLY